MPKVTQIVNDENRSQIQDLSLKKVAFPQSYKETQTKLKG